MCTADEGRNMREVFARYMSGSPVRESDMPALKSLSRTAYIEFYVSDGKLCARPGRIGSMVKSVDTQ